MVYGLQFASCIFKLHLRLQYADRKQEVGFSKVSVQRPEQAKPGQCCLRVLT